MSDAQAIAQIHVRSFQSAYTDLIPPANLQAIDVAEREAIWADRLCRSDSAELTVACGKDLPIGFIYYGQSQDVDDGSGVVADVYSLHVDPSRTGVGIGGRLLQQATKRLHSQGYQQLGLWVVRDNHRARQFYERHGWRPDGRCRTEPLALPRRVGFAD